MFHTLYILCSGAFVLHTVLDFKSFHVCCHSPCCIRLIDSTVGVGAGVRPRGGAVRRDFVEK